MQNNMNAAWKNFNKGVTLLIKVTLKVCTLYNCTLPICPQLLVLVFTGSDLISIYGFWGPYTLLEVLRKAKGFFCALQLKKASIVWGEA